MARVRRHRAQYRQRRVRNQAPVVSLVGYTNAGKSSMLNLLSHASVLARDQLFSTLDPVTRRVFLADGSQVLMTDTVGFIQKLPTGLVAAFRATLEELEEAAVLLHVVDISHPNAPEQVEVVEGIIRDLGHDKKPRVLALNKVDLLDPGVDQSFLAQVGGSAAVLTSAATGLGMAELLEALQRTLAQAQDPVRAEPARAGAP